MKKEMADALLQIMQDNAEPLGKWIAENGDVLAALPDVIADADAQAAKVGELLKTGGLADFLSAPSLSGLGLLAYADVVDAQSKAKAGGNKGKKAKEVVLALWVRIPRPSGHPFHEHLATDSTVIRPPVPRASGH